MPDAKNDSKMIRVSKPLSTYTPIFNRTHKNRYNYANIILLLLSFVLFLLFLLLMKYFSLPASSLVPRNSVNLVFDTKLLTHTYSSLTKNTHTHYKTTTLSAKQHFLVFDVQIVHTRNTFKKNLKKKNTAITHMNHVQSTQHVKN